MRSLAGLLDTSDRLASGMRANKKNLNKGEPMSDLELRKTYKQKCNLCRLPIKNEVAVCLIDQDGRLGIAHRECSFKSYWG